MSLGVGEVSIIDCRRTSTDRLDRRISFPVSAAVKVGTTQKLWTGVSSANRKAAAELQAVLETDQPKSWLLSK